MIDIDQSDPDFVVLRPEGALSEDDFAKVASAIDERINRTDKIPNLVIRVDKLPYWNSIGALTQHFHLVKEHHTLVKKVAIVGDNPLLSVAPEIANMLVQAVVRRFPENKLDDALAWARAEKDDPGHFEILDDPHLPRDVIALRAVGIITAQDYEDVLVPLVEEKLKVHDKLKCLIVMDSDYATFSGDAAWSDMKFGLTKGLKFSSVALVTDSDWLKKTARLFGPLMPFAVKSFAVDELEDAKSWIKR